MIGIKENIQVGFCLNVFISKTIITFLNGILKIVSFHLMWKECFHFLNDSNFFQLWDIRDGMCKQTFPGHESDINAVTVSYTIWFF